MIVDDMIENEDGSATLTLDLSSEELQILITYAVNKLLEREIQNAKISKES